MTMLGLLILLAMLTSFGLDVTAGALNLRALAAHPPERFADVIDQAAWDRARAYIRDRTILDLTASGFKLAMLLVWWFMGGFPWLERVIGAWKLGILGSGAIYIGVLFLLAKLIALPFKIIGTFLVEARHGFNRTSIATFVGDKAKSFLLSLVLGGPFLIAVLYFFQYAGQWAWLACWGTATVFLVFVQYLAPTWLMPLFNRFVPLPEGPLRGAILDYLRGVGFPASNVYEMDGSRRSTKVNAFVTGFGARRRIVLFDTMVARHSVPEVVAVLAHEVGHARLRHIPKMTLFAVLYLGIMSQILAIAMGMPDLHKAFYMEHLTLHGGLIFFMLLVVPLDLLLGPAMKSLTRRYEYAADHFAATTLTDPGALAAALKKLAANNLTHLTPHPFHVFLHYSHPPVLQRIEAIERCAREGAG
ncbi:MAG: M48 family metallopeptidase [Magnetococcales bacterium]|nr:M48 family metallopeptidase [Magnetococcales bacterium]